MNIALLGAESSGKSSLAQALVAEIRAIDSAPPVVWVPETLRLWCEARGRTPLRHEQADILQLHHTHMTETRQQAGQDGWLIADTTPLMTAVYSQHYFSDTSLYTHAWHAQRNFEVTLLMGLDLPWQADGPWRDGPAAQQAVDNLLRTQLAHAGLGYTTIYGNGMGRTQAALLAIAQALPASDVFGLAMKKRAATLVPNGPDTELGSKFFSQCESCSDPECEHTLFTRLLTLRRTAVRPLSMRAGSDGR